MKTKHYMLILGLLLLGWLASLVKVHQTSVKVVYVPKVEVQYVDRLDPITIKRNNIRRQLTELYNIDQSEVDWWATQIVYACEAFDVPENIMMGVIAVESQFDIFAHNPNTGAQGPAQLMKGVWGKQIGLNIDDPKQNIYAGAYVLNHYRNKCGNWDCALKSYNVGLTNYLKGKNKPAQARFITKVKTELAMIDTHTIRNNLNREL